MPPKRLAHLAGFLYLLLAIIGPIGLMIVPDAIIVEGDAAATAQNMLDDESLYRIGLLSEAAIFLIEVVLVTLLFILLKPVNETLSLMAAFARLSMAVLQGVNVVIGFAALLVVNGDYLTSFETAQRHDLMLMLLDLRLSGVMVWEAFFALHLLILGYLLAQSGYVPRLLGWAVMVASVGYAAHGLGSFILPDSEASLQTVTVVLSVIPEVALTLWLLIRGVKVPSKQLPASA